MLAQAMEQISMLESLGSDTGNHYDLKHAREALLRYATEIATITRMA